MKEQNKMKKLMMAAAIVCAAVAANAASYSWNAIESFYWADDQVGGALAGSTIYAFDGNVYNAATVLLALESSGTAILDSALNHGLVNEWDGYDFAGTKDTPSGITDTVPAKEGDPTYINAFLVALSKDGKYATSYVLDPIKVTDTISTDGASIGVMWEVANLPAEGAEGWTAVATAVPEPTSGLLLLLGVAGLALRRRRA